MTAAKKGAALKCSVISIPYWMDRYFGIDLYPINFADQSSFHITIAFILSSGQMFNFFEYLWNTC